MYIGPVFVEFSHDHAAAAVGSSEANGHRIVEAPKIEKSVRLLILTAPA
jgi:hypothetical protein